MASGMAYFWPRFTSRPLFLPGYLLAQTIVLVAVLAGLWRWTLPAIVLSNLEVGLLLPIAIILGLKIPTLMHNVIHGNGRLTSRLVGELTASFILMSFGIVSI